MTPATSRRSWAGPWYLDRELRRWMRPYHATLTGWQCLAFGPTVPKDTP